MKISRVLSALGVLLAATSCVHDAPAPFGGSVVTPSFYGVGQAVPAAPQCAALSGVQVIETRAEPMVLGHRIHEERPSQRFNITSTTEPSKWVQDSLLEAFRSAVMPANTAGRGALLASIAALDLDEKTSFNSTYKARLVLDVTVTKPGSREACWTGRVDGQANNYGEAQKPENYTETLNKALDQAAMSLLNDQGFLDAVCGKCTGVKVQSL